MIYLLTRVGEGFLQTKLEENYFQNRITIELTPNLDETF